MELCKDDHGKLERARDQILAAHGDDPNVSGVGIGFRRQGGTSTGRPAVVVLVAKKRREALVSRRRLLPRTVEVDGTVYDVDVEQAGPFTSKARTALAPERAPLARAGVSDPITGRMRPPRQGASISNPIDGTTAGTLGMFVIDNTDDTVCLLTCNHVIARLGRGRAGEPIVQPGVYDGGKASDAIATLKRWAPIPTTGTTIDGAIAQLTDQSAYTMEVAKDLMAPVSAGHPVVGMVVAGDAFGGCLLSRMDLTLDALNVRLPLGQTASAAAADLPCAGPVLGVADPQPGMNIEKVGRTTGYSASQIIAIGVQSPVVTPIGDVVYKDQIYTEYFASSGDSGSVAFAGGEGNTPVMPGPIEVHCSVLSALSTYYRLPLTDDNALADKVRDEYFLQSTTGKMLVELAYVNSETLVDRLKNRQAQGAEMAYANQYYTKYHDFLESVLDDPDSAEVVTQEHLDDAQTVIVGLIQTGVLLAPEARLALKLYQESLVPTLGMNRREVLEYMRNPALYGQVYEAVAATAGIELNAPFKQRPPEPTS
jgi:hypothetical protein